MNPFTAELIEICRMFGAFEREAVCCGDVTAQQCIALQQLAQGELDIGGLAAFSGVSLSAMTRLIDGLERRSWVTRERPGDDRRRFVVGLTEAGRREAAQLLARAERAVGAVVAHIPADRREQVLESLRLVRQAMAAARQGGGGCCSTD